MAASSKAPLEQIETYRGHIRITDRPLRRRFRLLRGDRELHEPLGHGWSGGSD